MFDWQKIGKLFDLAVWGGDILGSNRIEVKLPNSNTVHSLELWAMQQEEDPELWDVIAAKGTYNFDEGSSYGGIDVFFNPDSQFITEEITFEDVVDLLENVHMHIYHPETGFRLDAPKRLTLKKGVCGDDGIAYRRISGTQKSFLRHPEYKAIREKRARLEAMNLG